MKLFGLLEDNCHQFDSQLAYTYQEESSSSGSFTKYAEELHKLQVAKAKPAEANNLPIKSHLHKASIEINRFFN